MIELSITGLLPFLEVFSEDEGNVPTINSSVVDYDSDDESCELLL